MIISDRSGAAVLNTTNSLNRDLRRRSRDEKSPMTCSPTAVAKLRYGLSELQAGDGLLDRVSRRPSCATRARLANRFILPCRCEALRRTPLHALVRRITGQASPAQISSQSEGLRLACED